MKSAQALPRYGSRRMNGRTDGKTDGQRQNKIPPPMAGMIKTSIKLPDLPSGISGSGSWRKKDFNRELITFTSHHFSCSRFIQSIPCHKNNIVTMLGYATITWHYNLSVTVGKSWPNAWSEISVPVHLCSLHRLIKDHTFLLNLIFS
ncbi:hypothetical protein DPMN_018538 [Dreissena polymorpha]|uniref:Uncharacterized protein n=1 Tax=Dreissena polymorpha TaxID=45954 RepID=A0A9D4NGR8_DREPO|nr:hypothetical protein DPMN_018538 [Dreissena polymorpha]